MAKVGRPLIKIDQLQVEKLAEKQWSILQIAGFFRCSADVIERRFLPIIKEARHRGSAKLVDLQWVQALKGSDKMIIHMSKHYLGQTDKLDLTNTPKGTYGIVERFENGEKVGDVILEKKTDE